jgi:hypothetical protein
MEAFAVKENVALSCPAEVQSVQAAPSSLLYCHWYVRPDDKDRQQTKEKHANRMLRPNAEQNVSGEKKSPRKGALSDRPSYFP